MKIFSLFILLFFGSVQAQEVVAQSQKPTDIVTLIRIEGPISPLTTNYVKRGLKVAREKSSLALIIEMDTPGGLLESTKDIV